MKNKNLARRRVHNIVVVTKKIITVLKKLNHMEKQNDVTSAFYQKHVDLLSELLVHERSLCEKISKDTHGEELIYAIIENPGQFKEQFALDERTFARFFRNLFVCDQVKNQDLDISALHTLPQFSELEYQITNNNYPKLFEAFSVDLLHAYLKLIDKKIKETDDPNLQKFLIDEKYKIFVLYANTNDFLVKHLKNQTNEIESEVTKELTEENIDERVYDFLVADFSYNFCLNFYNNTLILDDKTFKNKKQKKENVMKFMLFETVLLFTNKTTRENLENLFYRKYYEINKEKLQNNREVAANILNVFDNFRKKAKTFSI